MDSIDKAEIAYANAAYQRAAAIAYARTIGEPIAHHRLAPGMVVEGGMPSVPLRSVIYQKRPSLSDHRVAPMWMNVGFGIELGLKGLYLLSQGSSPPHGHNTSTCFGLLDKPERDAVESELTAVLNELESAGVLSSEADRSGLTIGNTLKRFGDDFVEFRYIHEGVSLPDHANAGWVRLRAPSLWFSLDTILRVLRARLVNTGRKDVNNVPFESLASATL